MPVPAWLPVPVPSPPTPSVPVPVPAGVPVPVPLPSPVPPAPGNPVSVAGVPGTAAAAWVPSQLLNPAISPGAPP